MLGNKITLNVLAHISKKVNNGGCTAPRDNVLVIFSGSNINMDSRIEELKRVRERGFNISIAFSFMGERILNKDKIVRELNPINIYGEEDIFQLKTIVEGHTKLIMPNITMNTLSKVVLGMIDSLAATILWTYLYKGKDVYIDFNSVNKYLGKETENRAIKGLINNHIQDIKSMGAKELAKDNYLENMCGEEKLVARKGNNDLVRAKKAADSPKQLFTEKDILGLTENTVLKLPKGSIITPLARDRAKEMGIKIER